MSKRTSICCNNTTVNIPQVGEESCGNDFVQLELSSILKVDIPPKSSSGNISPSNKRQVRFNEIVEVNFQTESPLSTQETPPEVRIQRNVRIESSIEESGDSEDIGCSSHSIVSELSEVLNPQKPVKCITDPTDGTNHGKRRHRSPSELVGYLRFTLILLLFLTILVFIVVFVVFLVLSICLESHEFTESSLPYVAIIFDLICVLCLSGSFLWRTCHKTVCCCHVVSWIMMKTSSREYKVKYFSQVGRTTSLAIPKPPNSSSVGGGHNDTTEEEFFSAFEEPSTKKEDTTSTNLFPSDPKPNHLDVTRSFGVIGGPSKTPNRLEFSKNKKKKIKFQEYENELQEESKIDQVQMLHLPLRKCSSMLELRSLKKVPFSHDNNGDRKPRNQEEVIEISGPPDEKNKKNQEGVSFIDSPDLCLSYLFNNDRRLSLPVTTTTTTTSHNQKVLKRRDSDIIISPTSKRRYQNVWVERQIPKRIFREGMMKRRSVSRLNLPRRSSITSLFNKNVAVASLTDSNSTTTTTTTNTNQFIGTTVASSTVSTDDHDSHNDEMEAESSFMPLKKKKTWFDSVLEIESLVMENCMFYVCFTQHLVAFCISPFFLFFTISRLHRNRALWWWMTHLFFFLIVLFSIVLNGIQSYKKVKKGLRQVMRRRRKFSLKGET